MNRKLLVVIIIVAVLAGGLYLAWPTLQGLMTSSADNEDANLEYLIVERGTLSSSVSATGSVEPRAETVLSFETSGRIVE